MRIAHVTDCHLPRMGGIERQVEGLTRAQTAIGHDWRRWPITWTAVSEVAAASLSEVLRPHSAISVLPNGVTPALWSVRPLHFFKTLRAVRAQVPASVRLQVRIVGDGPRREAMRHYLDRHQMSDWVQLTGQLDQPAIRELFCDADLYASPATLESFGIAALEARCAGLPVVAFAGTGVSDFVQHGRNGLLVDNDAAMANALATLARSAGARDELSEHNRMTGSG